MLLSPFADEIVDLVCEEQVPVVTTGAGNPAKYMARFKEHNIKVIPVVPSVALAKRMEKIGADAVIFEGMEAGGHIGKLTTMSGLPQIVDAVSIPVIAAGGIGDGRGMAAAFMLGAEAVQLGTRFLIAKECNVHPDYKQKVLKARDLDAVITCQHFGHPVRTLKNKLTAQLGINFSAVGSEIIAAKLRATVICKPTSTFLPFAANNPLKRPGKAKMLFT
ncbi:Dioxygenases related to 2-nitropropane dioxygenase [Enterococcus faecalis]|nr:Dioxygenases related to 2-nitropropane dioxygenase [Enterococcus faecalis]